MHSRSFHRFKKQHISKFVAASTNPAHLLLDAVSALEAQTLLVFDAREVLAQARRRRDMARLHVETEQASKRADLAMSVRHRIKFRVRDHEIRVELLMRLYDAHRIATIDYKAAWSIYRDGVVAEERMRGRVAELKAQISAAAQREEHRDESHERMQ